MKLLRIATTALLFCLAAGCGTSESATTDVASAAVTNACPVEGCSIAITDVIPEAGELRVTWNPNFAPDFSKNHIHLYWDTYTAEQVSGNAEVEYGVDQGNWVPTDAMPNILTEGAVSVTAREGSTRLCVTAADFDHNILDPDLVQCVDVSEHL